MVENINLNKLTKDSKIEILRELGFDSDGLFVLQNGEKVIDKYINQEIKLDNMLILPGSTIILDNNPVSIASYIEEYNDVF